MQVYIVICMQRKHKPMQEWICMKCPRTSHVEVMLVRHSCHSHRFWNSQTLSNVHFHWANKLTICTDNGLQTSITAILSTHLLHGFILNAKCTEWFDLIETLYLLVVFLETIFCQSNMFIFCECYVPNNFSYLKTMKVEEKNKWMIVKFHLPLTSLKELIC